MTIASLSSNAILEPPLTGVPYMVSEAVGSLDGPPLYRWIDSSQTLGTQARMHAGWMGVFQDCASRGGR